MRFDISMVAIWLITRLIVLKALGSVGIGTIVAAVLVEAFLGLITKMFGEKRDTILLKNNMNIE